MKPKPFKAGSCAAVHDAIALRNRPRVGRSVKQTGLIYVIADRIDQPAQLAGQFDTVWASEAARVIQIPHRAPEAKAFAESFIGTLKRECLNFFICSNRSQLKYILRT